MKQDAGVAKAIRPRNDLMRMGYSQEATAMIVTKTIIHIAKTGISIQLMQGREWMMIISINQLNKRLWKIKSLQLMMLLWLYQS